MARNLFYLFYFYFCENYLKLLLTHELLNTHYVGENKFIFKFRSCLWQQPLLNRTISKILILFCYYLLKHITTTITIADLTNILKAQHYLYFMKVWTYVCKYLCTNVRVCKVKHLIKHQCQIQRHTVVQNCWKEKLTDKIESVYGKTSTAKKKSKNQNQAGKAFIYLFFFF